MAGAADIRASKAYIQLYVQKQLLLRGLREAQKQLQDFGKAVRAIGYDMIKLGGAIAAPLLLVAKPAADLQTVMSKFNVVFGDNARAVEAWGKTFAGEVGRSRRQIAEFLADSQDLFVPLGFSAAIALDMSKTITALSIDLGSLNRKMSDTDAMRDLQAALTGSGEVMKKYGVIVSEAAVKQELLNQGIKPSLATQQEKVQARLNIIMAGTRAAQGQAARTSDDWAEALKRLRGRIEDLSAAAGGPFLGLLTRITDGASTVAGWLTKWAEKHPALIGLVGKLAIGVTALGAATVAMGAAASGLAWGFGKLLKIVTLVSVSLLLYKVRTYLAIPLTKIFTVSVHALSFAMKKLLVTLWALVANPVGATLAAIGIVVAALVAGFVFLVTYSQKFRDALTRMGETVGKAFSRLGESLAGVLEQFGELAALAVNSTVELLETSGAVDVLIFGMELLAAQIVSVVDGVRGLIGVLKQGQGFILQLTKEAGLIGDMDLEIALKKLHEDKPAGTGPQTEEAMKRAKELADQEAAMIRRVAQLKLQAIEDQYKRERALLNEQYDHEHGSMIENGATQAALDAQEKARALELAAIKKEEADDLAKVAEKLHDAKKKHLDEIHQTEQGWSRDLKRLELQGIEDPLDRKLALIDQRYDAEIKAAKDAAGTDWIETGDIEKARTEEKWLAEKAAAAAGAGRMMKEKDRLAGLRVDRDFSGVERELQHLKLERAKALREATGVGMRDLISQGFDVRKDLVFKRAVEALDTANRGTFSGGEISSLGTISSAERTARATEQTRDDQRKGLAKLDEQLTELKRLTLQAAA